MQYQWCHIFILSLVFFSFLLSEKVLRITFQRGLTKFTWNFSLLELINKDVGKREENYGGQAHLWCVRRWHDSCKSTAPVWKVVPKASCHHSCYSKTKQSACTICVNSTKPCNAFFLTTNETRLMESFARLFLIVPVKEWHHVHRTRSIFV